MNYRLLLNIFVIGLFISQIPAAYAVSIERKVIAGSDDAYELNGKMILNGPIIAVGKDDSIIFRGAYRFINLNIPKGVNITKATLTLSYNWRSAASTKTILYGENSDNTSAFGINNNDISSRPKTAASVSWNNIPSGAWGTPFTSPDISGIVQEIVNRAGWSDGNSITILHYEDTTTTELWEAISYEEGTIYSPILMVEYSTGTSPTPTTPPSPTPTASPTATPPTQPIKTIMFRDDDIQPGYNFDTFKKITDTLITNRIPQTIGVIPYAGGNSIGSDTKVKNYLNTIKNYDTVELAMHGYRHTSNEFGRLNQATAEARIKSGLAILKSDLNLVPVTFIPPYHAYNTATVNAVKNKGLTRFSTALYNDNYPWEENPAGLLHVPAVSDFYDWDENRPRTYDEITSDCQSSLEQYDACVILLHFSDFKGSGSAVVDPVRYQTLLDVIDWTHEKESEGIRLATIKQYGK